MQNRTPISLYLIAGLALLSATLLHAADDGGRMLLDLAVAGGAAADRSSRSTVTAHGLGNDAAAPGWAPGSAAIRLGREQSHLLVACPGLDALLTNRRFTVEAWIRPDRGHGHNQILHALVQRSPSGHSRGAWALGFEDGVPYFSVWVPGSGRRYHTASGGAVLTGDWVHLAAVCDDTRLVLWVNGREAGRAPLPPGALPRGRDTGRLLIGAGCNPDAPATYQGLVGRVRLRAAAATNFLFDAPMRTTVAAQQAARAERPDDARLPFRGADCVFGPRPGSARTPLAEHGTAQAAIIAPVDEAPQREARRLAQAIRERCGVALPVLTDAETTRGRCRGLKPEWRDRPLILLGNINNNEALIPLYARFLAYADADYPGPGGYALRTLRNPHGTLHNALVLEASDDAGLTRVVDALLAHEALETAPGRAACAFLLEARPNLPDAPRQALERCRRYVKGMLQAIPADAPASSNRLVADVDAPVVLPGGYLIGDVAQAYALTGDPLFAEVLRRYARQATRSIGAVFSHYGHYRWEPLAHAYQMLGNLDLLDDATLRRLDMNMLLTLFDQRRDYGLRQGAQPIGGRHQLSATMGWIKLIDELRRNLAPETDPAVGDFVRTYFDGPYAHFRRAVAITYSGRDDSNSTAENMLSLFQFALMFGETAGFENGLAFEGAKRMLASVDNLGYGLGSGNYEDAYAAGATKITYNNGAPLVAAAFYFRDGGLKWLLENRPGFQVSSWFGRFPFGLHRYAADDRVRAVSPGTRYQTFSVAPRPFAVHGYRPSPGFPRDRLYDKAVLRSGSGRDDAYLCFQGPGSVDEGGSQSGGDALALLRYTDRGVLWLAANSQLTDAHWKSGLTVSSGFGGSAGHPYPRLDFIGATNDLHVFRGTLPGVRGGAWSRLAAYHREHGLLLLDRFQAATNGVYALCQTLRTPVPARVTDDGFVCNQSGWRLQVLDDGRGDRSLDHGYPELDAQPFWHLRVRRDASLQAGESAALPRLLVLRRIGDARPVDWRASLAALTAGLAGIPELAEDLPALAAVPDPPFIVPVPPSAPPRGLAIVREFPRDFGLEPARVRGYDVVSPELERRDALDDNVTRRWDPGAAIPPGSNVIVDLQSPVELARIVVEARSIGPVTVEGGLSPDLSDAAGLSCTSNTVAEMRELYKMTSMEVRVHTLTLDRPARVRYLRLAGLPESVSELAFETTDALPAAIRALHTADLDGDGRPEALVECLDRRLAALDAEGRCRFDLIFGHGIQHVLADDLDGDGQADLVVATADQRLRRYGGNGELTTTSAPLPWLPYTLNACRLAGGQRGLAVTYYYHDQFFNARLEPLHDPVSVGAMWVESAGALDVTGDGIDDLVAHDIFYRGHWIDGATRAAHPAPGQTAGLSHGFWPWSAVRGGGRDVLAGGQSGLVLTRLPLPGSAAPRRVTDGSLLNAVLPVDLDGDGEQEVVAAKANGHLVFFGHDLEVRLAVLCPGIVRALAAITDGPRPVVLAATSAGLRAWRADGMAIGFLPGDFTHLASIPGGFWAIRDGRLILGGLD